MEANMVRSNISSPELTTVRQPTVDRTSSIPERATTAPRELSQPTPRFEQVSRQSQVPTPRPTPTSAPDFGAMGNASVDILSAHPSITPLSTEHLTFGIPFSSEEVSEASISRAIQNVNNSLQLSEFRLSHNIHEDTNMVMVQVIDSNTQEVLREIPSESRLDLIARMREFVGILFDATG